jgi:cobalamin synthase
MILSEKKSALAVCAWITGGGAVMALALSVRLLFGGPITPLVEHTTIALCALAVLSWLVTMLLMTEVTRANRGGGQISAAVRHCPVPLKVAAAVGIVLASLQMIPIGEVSAVPGQAMTPRELRGFLSGAVVFLCLSFPVIASAALMKGGYGD